MNQVSKTTSKQNYLPTHHMIRRLNFLPAVTALGFLGAVAGVATSHGATTVLPLLSGHQSIAEWGGSTTYWTQPGPGGAPVAAVVNTLGTPGATSGSFLLSTNKNVGAFGFPAYLPSARDTTYTIGVTGYSGPAPAQLTIQLVSSYEPGTLTLSLGSSVFAKADAIAQTPTASILTGENSERYEGVTTGIERLYSYTWDLSSYAGPFPSDFSLSFFRAGTNFNVYDVQLSIVPGAVPEPSVSMLALLGGSFLVMRRCRPVPAVA